MGNGLPLKLSQTIINELYFSIRPEKDNFALNRLKKTLKSILQTPEADINDHYALALVEYNLGNYDSSLKIISNAIRYDKEFIKLLAIAKLTLVQNNINFPESEESILDDYFKNSKNLKDPKLSFSVFLVSVSSISKRYFLRNKMLVELTYSSKTNLNWVAGPFSNNEKLYPNSKLNKPRDIGYYFDSNLQILIINGDLNDSHKNFLKSFLAEEDLENIISEYSPTDLTEERDYSLFERIEI